MMPTLCRLEIWSHKYREWRVAHAGVALLHPERYTQRLEANGKIGRATALDDRLQPTGEVWGPPTPPEACALCSEDHRTGSCLI